MHYQLHWRSSCTFYRTVVAAVNEQEGDVTVEATSTHSKLVHIIEKLVERVEKKEVVNTSTDKSDWEQKSPKADDKQPGIHETTTMKDKHPLSFKGTSWSCEKRGHIACDGSAQHSTVSVSVQLALRQDCYCYSRYILAQCATCGGYRLSSLLSGLHQCSMTFTAKPLHSWCYRF